VLQPGEICDDGNVLSADGCSADCGTIQEGWHCPVPGTRCVPTCGDGLLVGSETCDDRNRISDDGCSDNCLIEPGCVCLTDRSCSCVLCVAGVAANGGACDGPRCGDGVISGGEECDDGGTGDIGGYPGCTSSCRYAAYCGDGIVNGSEECDLGPNNGATYGRMGCTVGCRPAPYCGDGILDLVHERCDLGGANSDSPGADCSSDCQRRSLI